MSAVTQFDKIAKKLADAQANADLLVNQDEDPVESQTARRVGYMLLELLEGADKAAQKLFKKYRRVQGCAPSRVLSGGAS